MALKFVKKTCDSPLNNLQIQSDITTCKVNANLKKKYSRTHLIRQFA